LYEQLSGAGATATYTILDNDMVDADKKVEYLVEAGETDAHAREIVYRGAEATTTTAKREYFCEFVTDASTAVVPEYTPDLARRILKPWGQRPDFYDSYVSIDPGFKDRTGIIFASYDFTAGKLVIEAERLLSQASTIDITEALVETERELWGEKEVYARLVDDDLRLVEDLWRLHKISARPAKKGDALGEINLMRNMLQSETIQIDPRCTNLHRQLKNATWNNKATDFEQGGDIDGHYDLVAALKYLCRNLNRTRNPDPDNYYRRGRPLGAPAGSWVSPRAQRRSDPGLLSDTPFSRRLLKRK
jgi:hypothetical protein